MKKYFHELDKEEFSLVAKMTVKEVLENYEQPDWCDYTDALAGSMGCWSLVGNKIKSIKDCTNCDANNTLTEVEKLAIWDKIKQNSREGN